MHTGRTVDNQAQRSYFGTYLGRKVVSNLGMIHSLATCGCGTVYAVVSVWALLSAINGEKAVTGKRCRYPSSKRRNLTRNLARRPFG
jgi:hypothetical protein